jgi:hypothetical protein
MGVSRQSYSLVFLAVAAVLQRQRCKRHSPGWWNHDGLQACDRAPPCNTHMITVLISAPGPAAYSVSGRDAAFRPKMLAWLWRPPTPPAPVQGTSEAARWRTEHPAPGVGRALLLPRTGAMIPCPPDAS